MMTEVTPTTVQERNALRMAQLPSVRLGAYKDKSIVTLFTLPATAANGETHCEVSTHKNMRGVIVSSAMDVTCENGFILHKYGLMMSGEGGSWRTDLHSTVARATDKALMTAHRAGLTKLMELRPELFTAQ